MNLQVTSEVGNPLANLMTNSSFLVTFNPIGGSWDQHQIAKWLLISELERTRKETVMAWLAVAVAQSLMWQGCRRDNRGIMVRFPAGARYFSFVQKSRPTHPIEGVPSVCAPEVKRLQREADHFLLAPRVRMSGAILWLPPRMP
jgi:hypothetical protein